MRWQCWSMEEHPAPHLPAPVLTAWTHFSAGSKKSVIATVKRRWWELNQSKERGSGQAVSMPREGKRFKSIGWDQGSAVLPAEPAQRALPSAQKAPVHPKQAELLRVSANTSACVHGTGRGRGGDDFI